MSASTEFAASLPFLSYRQRNAVLDNFFYDTGSLTVEEKAKLSPLVDREGSIIVVPPSNSDRQIRNYKRALRFMNKEGSAIRAIAVAGVGSSALGTAALARGVADALDTDVAGIVTGYGLSDVMTEALGGWFVFGAADRIRYTMEKFFERMRTTMPADVVAAGSETSALWFDRSSLPGDNDVSTLSEILLAAPPALEYLVTHSKGSLVVSYALQQYVEDLEGDEAPLFERLRITTLGAVVGLPSAFKNVKQYLGALDWFGGANSSLGVKHERVPGVSHHLNPGFPYHMSVASLLGVGAAPRLLAKPPAGEMLAPLAIPPVAAVPKPKPAPAAAKPKEPVRKLPKKATKPATKTPKAASPAPKAVSAAPKVAAPAPKAVSVAAKVAGRTPKVVSVAAKAAVAEVKRPSPAAKRAIRPMAKKATAATKPASPLKAKTAAANGRLVVKTSRKGAR